ncbi:type I restriction-modification system subunit M N-terminal domain-containing protein [Halomonas ventosae]|uniref:Type I restriction enzyme M protein n=1 Tax=Halomonas ventosae TaxID=229007 RepID=A0A2T0VT29_9GAMM|nr:type I restriction-modification system subunit M N-terminal domain-containing protein [Halomonas ventosae]PRY73668.1 type I restriction enzyme M protein [Halomonas ventosae]
MFEQIFKNIDDVLWKEAGCATELDYTEQTSWLLFLKYLDDLEQNRVANANLGERKQSLLQKAFSGGLTPERAGAAVKEGTA